jgi:hypothetical protein
MPKFKNSEPPDAPTEPPFLPSDEVTDDAELVDVGTDSMCKKPFFLAIIIM